MSPKSQGCRLDVALKQVLQVVATPDSKAVETEIIMRFVPRVHGFLNLCSLGALSFLGHKYAL